MGLPPPPKTLGDQKNVAVTRQPEATQQKNHETEDHILGNTVFTAGVTDL